MKHKKEDEEPVSSTIQRLLKKQLTYDQYLGNKQKYKTAEERRVNDFDNKFPEEKEKK